MNVRQEVMKCVAGKIGRLITPEDQHDAVKKQCQDFARSRLIKLEFKSEGTLLKMRTLEKLESPLKYSEVDALEVGQSYLFELPEDQHQAVRSNMAYRQKRTGRAYRCEVDDDGLLVTRIPSREDNTHPEFILDTKRARATKYGLERLRDEASVVVNIERFEHDRVRLAAHRISIRHGWDVSCRAQKDGTMLVFRVDRMNDDSSLAEVVTTKTDLHDLARLHHERLIQITLPRTEHAALRVAVHRFAKKHGYTIRCRLVRETMDVERVDHPQATSASQ